MSREVCLGRRSIESVSPSSRDSFVVILLQDNGACVLLKKTLFVCSQIGLTNESSEGGGNDDG